MSLRHYIIYILLFQVVISAAYRQSPEKSSTGILTVSVERNPNCPQFNGPAQAAVPEALAPGSTVIFMNATDLDGDDIVYSLVHVNADTRNIFFIVPKTGEIITKNPITVSNFCRFAGRKDFYR